MRQVSRPMLPSSAGRRKHIRATAPSSERRAPPGLCEPKRKAGTRESRVGRHLRSKFTPSTANEARLVGLGLGVLSMLLPWASAITTDDGYVQIIRSYSLVDLLSLGDPTVTLILAAYVIGLAFALLYASSAVIVLASWFLQDEAIRTFLVSTANAVDPTIHHGVSFGIGPWVGLLGAFLLIVSMAAVFLGERYIPRDHVMPSEIYHRGTGKPGFWRNVNYFAYLTRLNERRRRGRP